MKHSLPSVASLVAAVQLLYDLFFFLFIFFIFLFSPSSD